MEGQGGVGTTTQFLSYSKPFSIWTNNFFDVYGGDLIKWETAPSAGAGGGGGGSATGGDCPSTKRGGGGGGSGSSGGIVYIVAFNIINLNVETIGGNGGNGGNGAGGGGAGGGGAGGNGGIIIIYYNQSQTINYDVSGGSGGTGATAGGNGADGLYKLFKL